MTILQSLSFPSMSSMVSPKHDIGTCFKYKAKDDGKEMNSFLSRQRKGEGLAVSSYHLDTIRPSSVWNTTSLSFYRFCGADEQRQTLHLPLLAEVSS
jgi:hypothetical protein